MSNTITVRLNRELSAWLEKTSAQTGVSQGQIVREQLARAKAAKANRAFMRWAGVIRGPKNLSSRKGFSNG